MTYVEDIQITHIRLNEYYSLESKGLLLVLINNHYRSIWNIKRGVHGQLMPNALSANNKCFKRILLTEYDDEQFEDQEVDELPDEIYQDEYPYDE